MNRSDFGVLYQTYGHGSVAKEYLLDGYHSPVGVVVGVVMVGVVAAGSSPVGDKNAHH
jgi:hypothetical protein